MLIKLYLNTICGSRKKAPQYIVVYRELFLGEGPKKGGP
jgi:hypothetical protein